MTADRWRADAWYRALTLNERSASLPAIADGDLGAGARQQIERWRGRSGLTAADAFARRLAADGISEAMLGRLLDEPIEAARARTDEPVWLARCAAAFSAAPPGEPTQLPLSERERDHPIAAVLAAFGPLIEQGRDRLLRAARARMRGRSGPVDLDRLGQVFVPELAARLVPMLSPTIVLELNVARMRGELAGDTPEERWRDFARRLRRTGSIVALLEEYPVLARRVAECIDDWVAARTAFIARLRDDWPALRDTFSPGRDPGALVRLVGDAGDTHRGGESVVIAEFASGLTLVYKPRSLAVEAHFQELLAWLNRRGDFPPFPTSRVIDRRTHGWVEFAAAAPCRSDDEVRRFYLRSGGYLALLHALCATDLHAENVIAAGEHPVLVDLEALFHPELAALAGEPAHPISLALESSVLRVGFLPQRRWRSTESDGIDLSGLSGAAGQLSPRPVRTLDSLGTDLMRFVRRRVPLPGARNRPTLLGAEVDVLDHTADIARGFEAVYRALLRCRDELLAPGGPLDRFADDEVRVIVRDTFTYARLLQESYHPDMLRDGLDRDCLLDQLWRRAEGQPDFAPIIAAERADVARGDLPRFVTRAGSRDLWTGPADRMPGFLAMSGLDLARRRLRALGEADLARQLWFIRASFATLAESDGEGEGEGIEGGEQAGTPCPADGAARDPGGPDRAELLAAARAIGDRLAGLAIAGPDQVAWLGITMTPRRDSRLSPLGADLYDGIPGVALFMAFLGATTGEAAYTELARSALQGLRRDLAADRVACPSIGGFTGRGGLVYCLTRLATLWDAPDLLADAEAIADGLPAAIERDDELDVLGGAAGCIAALLGLHGVTGSERALAVAIACGDHLIARARPEAVGIAWPTAGRPHGLTGFSHGAAGMAWSLLRLAAATGASRFRTAALDAIAYERSLFAAAAGNWPDLRRTAAAARAERDGRRAFLTAWCHGAPGIGLARLHGLAFLDDEATRSEIDVALHTTAARGFGRNHSLCHGDLGNIELLIEAGRRLGHPVWADMAGARARAILEHGRAGGWRSGAPFSVESPGLMTGLAGIGYGLLRLAAPSQVPSVLVLESIERPGRAGDTSEGTP